MNQIITEKLKKSPKIGPDSFVYIDAIVNCPYDLADYTIFDLLETIKRKKVAAQRKIEAELQMVEKDMGLLENMIRVNEQLQLEKRKKRLSLEETDIEDSELQLPEDFNSDSGLAASSSTSQRKKLHKMEETQVPKLESEDYSRQIFKMKNISPVNRELEKRDKLLNSYFADIERIYFEERTEQPFYLDTDLQNDLMDKFRRDAGRPLRYKGLEELATLQYTEQDSTSSIVSAVDLDFDEKLIATAGVARKIKIFDFEQVYREGQAGLSIHYPVLELHTTNKISSLCWNSYFKNLLISSDYEGLVQLWDTNTSPTETSVPFTYKGHEKRVWSVDFSKIDPNLFLTGSDDCKGNFYNTFCFFQFVNRLLLLS